MPRPFTRNQALENGAFLAELRRTGNIRLSARLIRRAYATMQHRRSIDAVFATEWDAALAFANARFQEVGGRQGPVAPARDPNPAVQHRTRGGEPVVVRRNDGKLQMRAAQPGKLTQQCEQAFLAALSATANVRLSAAAAGASVAAFYRRRRKNPGFAREMGLALQMGYQRLEAALLASTAPDSYQHDGWTHNDPPPIPSMTAAQALQLMYLHQKEARLLAEPPHLKRRRGECREAQSERIRAMGEARLQREREKFDIAEAARRAEGHPPRGPAILPPPPVLPSLDQVTGWSTGDPTKTPHHPDRALFGGWRLADLKERGSG